MRSNLPWAVLTALLASAEAKALRWTDDSPSWVPARETGAPKHIGYIPAAPEPTYMPTPNFDLMRRQSSGNNTCGYINGVFSSASAIVCNSGWECSPSTRLKVMGCCSRNNCVAETQCFNRAQSRSFTGDDGGRIRLCSDSRAPFCATGRFTNGAFSSYTVLFCDASSSRTYSLSYFSPTKASSTRSSSRSASRSSSSSSISSSSTTETPTPTPPASETQAPASSSPAGAIVGGVVGGIAAIGLIVLGAIFLWRRKSRDDDGPPPGSIIPGSTAYAAVAQYPPPQEDRTSLLMKPPYRGSGSVSPYDPSVASSSPPPGHPPQPYSNMPPSPQPPSTPFLQQAHYQPQPYGQQYQQSPPLQPQLQTYQAYSPQPYRPQQNAAELPAGRGDGELRELA
ncbi:hypothetical protein B0T16DRAFT_85173 [Cercophora newfieldiana]|uniref:Uncharacterized protein n=1 Tax=Cercophora newfieldiana TaxID=92897 RepID=A0AA39YFI6_9PEZI|nr:hypothetical protein B0T16DRAFT_85173 [Cercophora newfieldiana]